MRTIPGGRQNGHRCIEIFALEIAIERIGEEDDVMAYGTAIVSLSPIGRRSER